MTWLKNLKVGDKVVSNNRIEIIEESNGPWVMADKMWFSRRTGRTVGPDKEWPFEITEATESEIERIKERESFAADTETIESLWNARYSQKMRERIRQVAALIRSFSQEPK